MPTGSAGFCALLVVSLAAAPQGVRAQATSAACKPLLDANTREITTPHHAYSTETGSGKDAHQTTGEVISTATASYVLYKGSWKRIPMTPRDNLAQMQENLRNTKVYQCRQLPDERIDGSAANVYTAHSENEFAKTDAKLWVMKSSGLIAREEIDMYGDEGDGKRHMSERFDYKNVQPPQGVK